MQLLTLPSASERAKLASIQEIRRRNLDRLYERRALVDVLIRCLEEYERAGAVQAGCLELIAARMS